MGNDSIGQYISHDSPKNFAIRIKFWKVIPGNVIPSRSVPAAPSSTSTGNEYELQIRRQDDEKEEVTVYWQEKLFSQREFDFYSDSLNCVNSLEYKYHEDIENIKRTAGDRVNKRIFTYIDGDSFTALEELSQMTLSENEIPNVLVEKMSKAKHGNILRKPFAHQVGLRRRGVVIDRPTEAMKNNHVVTTPSKTMQVMVDLGSMDRQENYIEDERILCTIKIDAHGLIVIKPDVDTDEVFSMETYHETRSIYQYTIEHASKPMSKLEGEQEERLFTELYARHAQVMSSHVGDQMVPQLRKNELLVYSLIEIVSAQEFEYNKLYVEYYLELSSGWQSGSKQLCGVTQSCAMNKENIAQFSYPIDFELLYTFVESDMEEFVKWPVLYLQVYSLDSWQRQRIEGYGYCQLPDVAGTTCVEIDMWRPRGDSLFSEMNRFFIGGTPELKDTSYARNSQDGNSDGKLSKFYFKTVTTGRVVLKIGTIFQSKPEDTGDRLKIVKGKKNVRRAGGFTAAIDSFNHVLDAFHRARRRMLAARSTLPTLS